jgi:hypothetical protein
MEATSRSTTSRLPCSTRGTYTHSTTTSTYEITRTTDIEPEGPSGSRNSPAAASRATRRRSISKGRVYMIQKASPSKRSQKLTTRQVNMAETSPPATLEYLRLSEASITFSRADHLPKVPLPGKAALVVEAQIGGYDLARVFMAGGSGINIIYMETLKVMGVPTGKLQRSENAIHARKGSTTSRNDCTRRDIWRTW